MVEPSHTVCIRHLQDDLHLCRRQFQIHVIHPRRGNLSRPELKQELARKFNVSDTQTIFISGFQTKAPFSKGFGIIYDNIEDVLPPKLYLVVFYQVSLVNRTKMICSDFIRPSEVLLGSACCTISHVHTP